MREQITLITLPYETQALEPIMSSATIDYHYNNLARGYVNRNNDGIGGENFNKFGATLHNLFFEQFKPPTSNLNSITDSQDDLFIEPYLDVKPFGISSEVIAKKWKTFEEFQTEFENTALQLEGSGWVFLDSEGVIRIFQNHYLPVAFYDVIILVDLWEHAWALDYTWNKVKYLKNIWKLINWEVINNRITQYESNFRPAIM
jgi:Fe-Mn family superoxide dismutase